MHKTLPVLALTLCMLAYSGCAPFSEKLESREQQTAAGDAKKLRQGRIYYLRSCGACHRYYKPEERTYSEWQAILAKKMPKLSLRESQFESVKKYILHNSIKDLPGK